MRNTSRLLRTTLALSQALLILVGNNAVVYAQATAAPQLDGFEKTVFGSTRSSLSEESRLRALEMNLFGKYRNGTSATRIAAINKALDKQSNLLAPPMAPKLDPGTPADDAPQSAPPSYQAYNESDEPPAAANPAKDMLRQAMERYSAGDQAGAEKLFRKVLKLDSNNGDAYYNLGVISEGKGDLQGALDNYKASSRINPSDNDLRDAVSSVQKKLNDKIAQDEQQRQQQLQAQKDEEDQRNRDKLKGQIADAASAYKAGNYDKAIQNLQSVSAQAPRDPDVQYALAQAYRAKGNMQSARQALNKALAIDPSNQLYKNSLSDINREVADANQPKPAPTTAYEDQVPPGKINKFSNHGSSHDSQPPATPYQDQTAMASDDDQQAGQLTPFSNSNQQQFERGYASSSTGRGFGSMAGSRIKRAAIGGLTGAAMGMVFSGIGGGGYRSRGSLMKGALIGGGLGALMGGLSGGW